MTRFTQGGVVRAWVSGQGKKSRVPRQMILKFSFEQFLNTICMKKSIVYDGRETQDIELQQDAARDAVMLEFLTQFITDERRQRFEEILDFRTRHITVVLEDIFQPHNASAVLRSCELRGIQDVHIVENMNHYDVNPEVVMGSTKWLNLYHYEDMEFNTSWLPVRIATISRPKRFLWTNLSLWSSARRSWASLTMPLSMPTCTCASRCTASRRATTSAFRRPC